MAFHLSRESAIDIWLENTGKRWVALDCNSLRLALPRNKITPPFPVKQGETYELAPSNKVLFQTIMGTHAGKLVQDFGFSGKVPFKVQLLSTEGKRFKSKRTVLNTVTGEISDT